MLQFVSFTITNEPINQSTDCMSFSPVIFLLLILIYFTISINEEWYLSGPISMHYNRWKVEGVALAVA